MKLSIQVPPHLKKTRLVDYLEKELLIPRKIRYFLRETKGVLLNGKLSDFVTDYVRENDILVLTFLDEWYEQPMIPNGNHKLCEVLFEDEHLIIVNKPEGIKTHPNDKKECDTLLNHVSAHLKNEKGKLVPYVVHRLDKETSGAVLFAKNPIILPVLTKMLEQHGIHRTYQAIVAPPFQKQPMTLLIDKKIGRNRHENNKYMVDEKKGKHAITKVKVLSQTHVECQLETGRTHQIRVHLSDLGHPIVGDPLYNPKRNMAERMMLHAKQIEFIHPFTKEKLQINTPDQLF